MGGSDYGVMRYGPSVSWTNGGLNVLISPWSPSIMSSPHTGEILPVNQQENSELTYPSIQMSSKDAVCFSTLCFTLMNALATKINTLHEPQSFSSE